MTEEFGQAAQTVAAVRGFPRGNARSETAAQCATLFDSLCTDPQQAQAAADEFLKTSRNWRGIAHLEKFLELFTGGGADTTGLRALGQAWRNEPHYHGFSIPDWVRPPGATDLEIGRNILTLEAETEKKIVQEIQKLNRTRQRALYQCARESVGRWFPPAAQPAELNREISLRSVFDMRTMHAFAAADDGQPDTAIGDRFEEYLAVIRALSLQAPWPEKYCKK
jgi:hypothetical protein